MATPLELAQIEALVHQAAILTEEVAKQHVAAHTKVILEKIAAEQATGPMRDEFGKIIPYGG